jgi:hypothetical protein
VYYYYEDGTTRYIDSDRLVAVDRWKGKDLGWLATSKHYCCREVFSSFHRLIVSFPLSFAQHI